MSMHKEIEFKNLLEQKEFEALCQKFNLEPQDFRVQTNTYFDTPDFSLRGALMGFRLRVTETRNELTLKAPGDNSYTMLETTRIITDDDRDHILKSNAIRPGEYDEFSSLPEILHSFGSLRTERAEVPFENGLLVLDRSEYLGHTDFEVEYEVQDLAEGQASFLRLLEANNIPQRDTPKKIARFMNAGKLK